MTTAACPAFYPIGPGGVLHRTEPELNAFVKRYLGREMSWLKSLSEHFLKETGEVYKVLVGGEINPKPKYSDAAGKFRGHVALVLVSDPNPGQWVYPLTIIFNGGCASHKPKSLIEVPIETGLRYEYFPTTVQASLGTKKYLMAKRSHREQIIRFLDQLPW